MHKRLTDGGLVFSRVIRTDVFAPDAVGPSDLGDKFRSIETNLDDVVEQSKRWRQREGGHEERHEPVLDYCGFERKQVHMFLKTGHCTPAAKNSRV